MLLIVAGAGDHGARVLAHGLRDRDARVLTPRGLSVCGWRHDPADPDRDRALVCGERVEARAITGVISRLAGVRPQDLPHIEEGDRDYVAAEMHAFLLSFLSSLRCPLLNRPSASTLVGPAWSRDQWLAVAAQLGARTAIASWRATASLPWPAPGATATVVGGRAQGAVAPSLLELSERIAKRAGAELLAVHFSSPDEDASFVSASPWTDVVSPAIQDSLASYFGPRRAA